MPQIRYLKDVTTLDYDAARCTGCGMCAVVCPHAVFEVADGKARIIDRDACMECGACALNCAAGAISVEAGVGCAAAVIQGTLKGTEPTCGCSDEPGKPCC
jgi:ferredoxin